MSLWTVFKISLFNDGFPIGLIHSPTPRLLEQYVDELNAGRPQCPVGLNTLVVPRRQNASSVDPDAQPMVYLDCGHVQVLGTRYLDDLPYLASHHC